MPLNKEIKPIDISVSKECFLVVRARLPYLPTPPLGQDMTQGQFLNGV